MFRKKQGITLIALIITIVILLILAVVAITSLTEKNGLFTRTKQATEKQNYESAKEVLNLKLMEIQTDCMANNKVYDLLQIAKAIAASEETTVKKYFYGLTSTVQDVDIRNLTNLEAIAVQVDKYKKYTFLIGKSLTIEGITFEEVNNETKKSEFSDILAFEKNPTTDLHKKVIVSTNKIDSTYYGKYVDYIPVNGCNVKWRIFYKDEENVYLLADDYIENIYFPSEIQTTEAYSKYCGYVNTNREDLINIMKNTEKWSSFLDTTDNTGIAKSATGGPTLQQFATSWNTNHTPIITINPIGNTYYINGTTNLEIGVTDSMYVKNSVEKAYGFLFASAAARDGVCLFESFYDGVIHSDSFAYRYHNRGFCPLICLKENVNIVIEK